MSSAPATRNNTDKKEDTDGPNVSHNAGGNKDISASSGGTKSGKKDKASEEQHINSTAEQHWGTTQKYMTQEDADAGKETGKK
ncbi:hypothetical protein HKX48_000350 [Thoreauomyces humboldtii]|nr:hypothetical protein HKX48_000350 [Thoreauomyces humboldtii]